MYLHLTSSLFYENFNSENYNEFHEESSIKCEYLVENNIHISL